VKLATAERIKLRNQASASDSLPLSYSQVRK